MSDAQNIVHISSLLASRLCHDLVNPVGALSTGLDVLGEGDDPEMQAHAMALIKESTHKTIAILTLARLAYGSSGGWEGDLDMGEAKPLATDFFVHSKAELVWKLTESAMAKPRARALLCLLIIAERTAPRAGSQVVIAKEGEGYTVTATGPKVKFSDEVRQAVAGDVQNLQAKETPAYLAYLLCQAQGDTVSAHQPDEQILIFKIQP